LPSLRLAWRAAHRRCLRPGFLFMAGALDMRSGSGLEGLLRHLAHHTEATITLPLAGADELQPWGLLVVQVSSPVTVATGGALDGWHQPTILSYSSGYASSALLTTWASLSSG
jgi:hypothetical protein